MKSKLIPISVLLITLMLHINCSSGSSNSITNKLLLLELSDNLFPSTNLSQTLSESILEDESYQYIANVQSKNGIPLHSDLDVMEYNQSQQSYYFNAELQQNQTYILQFNLVKHITGAENWLTNTTNTDETWLNLSTLTLEFTVNDNITTLDLSATEWQSTFDNDNDGVTNLVELNQGTNPFMTDSDADGTDDLNDAFPLNSSESTDTDQDGVGSITDNCPQHSNTDQANIDADSDGDACDADNDNDGIENDMDNCPLIANTSQTDMDSDSIGDTCDDDRDGDGLSNPNEQTLGLNSDVADSDGDGSNDFSDVFPLDSNESADTDLDGVGNNSDNCAMTANSSQTDTDSDAAGDACDVDDDADGILDNSDNCPTTLLSDSLTPNQTLQIDLDSDGFGTPCDCDDSDAAIQPQATDKPDSLMIDANCDGLDGDLTQAILVAADEDFAAAYDLAKNQGLDLYLSEGTHTLTDAQLSDKVSIYGGFADDFSVRESRPSFNHTTTLILETSATTSDEFTGLNIVNVNENLTMASLVLQTNSLSTNQIVVSITDSNVTLENLHIEGNPLAMTETLILVEDASLQANALKLTAHANSSSFGISADTIAGHVTNSIFDMNTATHTTALSIENSEFDLINNTIDAGSHEIGTAYGLQFTNSELNIINNIFIGNNSVLQASIRCNGSLNETPLVITSNLFLRYSPSNNTIYPAYISCDDAKSYLSTTTALEDVNFTTELTAADNLVDNRTRDRDNISMGLTSLLDANYSVVESGTTYIHNQGEDTSDFGVEYDFENDLRDSLMDRGADEF